MSENRLTIFGIPDSIPEDLQAVYRSRLIRVTNEVMRESESKEIEITISSNGRHTSLAMGAHERLGMPKALERSTGDHDELTIELRAQQYTSQEPLFDFDFLVVSEDVLDTLMLAVSLIQLGHKVFDDWGLRRIEPFPRTALNFHGPPGTGKTLAAHAIASYLDRSIMIASYAQIESKYHGEGPKNVEALFYAAERDRALLFIDEADSLLSKRLTNVSQGSEQAINSMRSQLLICLEGFKGIVVFSTNLVTNYDKAFETRVRSVHFPMPDEECRKRIWSIHLGDGKKPPLADDIDIAKLAKVDDFCGRDIKNSILDAALSVARERRSSIEQKDLEVAVEQVRAARIEREPQPEPQPADPETSSRILESIKGQEILEERESG